MSRPTHPLRLNESSDRSQEIASHLPASLNPSPGLSRGQWRPEFWTEILRIRDSAVIQIWDKDPRHPAYMEHAAQSRQRTVILRRRDEQLRQLRERRARA